MASGEVQACPEDGGCCALGPREACLQSGWTHRSAEREAVPGHKVCEPRSDELFVSANLCRLESESQCIAVGRDLCGRLWVRAGKRGGLLSAL